jgi:hypothetical protein
MKIWRLLAHIALGCVKLLDGGQIQVIAPQWCRSSDGLLVPLAVQVQSCTKAALVFTDTVFAQTVSIEAYGRDRSAGEYTF